MRTVMQYMRQSSKRGLSLFYVNNIEIHTELKRLSNKFTSFLKLIEKAKKIQEIKLKKYGTARARERSMLFR